MVTEKEDGKLRFDLNFDYRSARFFAFFSQQHIRLLLLFSA
jgi:hypothetical protein